MRYIAICFADKTFEKSAERYVQELKSKNFFDEVLKYSPEDFDDNFKIAHQDFIKKNKKGYGYYIWKPYVILKALKSIQEGDILVYGDAGNDIPGSKERCLIEFNKVLSIKKGVKLIASKQGWAIRWIKTDLYFAMGWTSIFYSFKRMVEAGRVVMQKNDETIKFMEEWLHYATVDYHNIDDSESRLFNLPFFIEHRNDQSIFTLLFHKYSGTITDFGEVWRARRLKS